MRLSEVVFLDAAEVERAHAAAIVVSGGSPGLRDRGMLESAVATPQTTVFGDLAHPTLAKMAAALAYSLAQNHPFVDGNKRAACTAALIFLELNGHALTIPQSEWEDVFVRLADGKIPRDELAERFASALGSEVAIIVD